MALAGGQVSVTSTAQNLTTLLSRTANSGQNRCFAIEVENASDTVTIYEGPSTVTSVPANSRGTVPATTGGARWWSQPPGFGEHITTDEVYLVASTTVTAYVRLYQ